jgi:uncharacterized membrane protein YqhA
VADDGTLQSPGRTDRIATALTALLRACRLLVVLPIVVLALSAVAAFVETCYLLVSVIGSAIQAPNDTGKFAIGLVKVIDVVLIGIVLFIVAVGLEELFMGGLAARRTAWLPSWLAIHSLDDLKELVLSTLVLVVVVTFVDAVVSSAGNLQVLELGGATGAIVVAIAIYLRIAAGGK